MIIEHLHLSVKGGGRLAGGKVQNQEGADHQMSKFSLSKTCILDRFYFLAVIIQPNFQISDDLNQTFEDMINMRC